VKTHSAYTRPRIRVIQQAVCDHYQLRTELMRERIRTKDIATARMVAMALCRTLTKHSLQDIGASFERDHGTVIHAIQKVTDWRSTDITFRIEYDTVEGLARSQVAALYPSPTKNPPPGQSG
jgi:chromosomal replication initiator protein